MTVAAGRPRLRELRDELGWTQQELAERLAHLAWMRRREHVAVNADMVAKWERGVKGISARYRDLLCLLFGVTAEQLGLAPAKRTTPAPVPPARPQEDESLVSLLDNAASVLDHLGAAGTVLAPQMLDVWKDTVTSRRTMFALLDPAATDPAGHARTVTASVDDLEQLADRYAALYPTAAPQALLTAVAAHVRMTGEALATDHTPADRRRLLRNRARVAVLAGRLACDDLGDAMSGHAYYSLAIAAARESGDDHTAALAHGYAAHLAAAEGCPTAALDHLAAANHHAVAAPVITSWLAATEAVIHADTGNHQAAAEALDRARAALDKANAGETLPFDTHDTATLDAAAGHVALRAGDHARARDTLAQALRHMAPAVRRQRILSLVDQATAELHTGNPHEALRDATQAAELLARADYATGTAYLRAFRTAAERPLGRRALRTLDDHLTHPAA